MKSMTGFGEASASLEELTLAVDVRTVNSRYLEVHPRLPSEFAPFEPEIRRVVKESLARGRVDLFVHLEIHEKDHYQLNRTLLQNYLGVAEEARDLGIKGELTLSDIYRLPGLLTGRPIDFRTDRFLKSLLEVLGRALEQVVANRKREGESLQADLLQRTESLLRLVDDLERCTAGLPDQFRLRIEKRLERIPPQFDEGRIAQEVIFLAERADVSEEMTRLRSHLERFLELCGGEGKAIGKNLDFLCQELHREMNTIGSKAVDKEVSALVVEGKLEIEKLREQVQNVE